MLCKLSSPSLSVAVGLAAVLNGPAAPVSAEGPACPAALAVVDPSGQPVPGASVSSAGSEFRADADAAGAACLGDLAPGRHRLVVVADGFLVREATVSIPDAAEPVRFEVALQPAFGEELVVTATRTARRLAEVPVHIQVTDRDRIEASVARTLADAVEWTSGVRVESNCQNCNFSQVRMLGLEGPYSQVLVDGQPTVSSLAMVYGIEQIPARLIDSIEVVKGGGSAVYGAGAVGGVINLIPHQPSHTGAVVESRFTSMDGEGGGSLSALADWASGDRQRSLTAFGQADRVAAVDLDGDRFTEVTRRELEAFGVRFDQYLLDDRARFALELNRTHEDRRGGDDRFDLAPHETALTEEIVTERRGATASWLHTVSPRIDYRLAVSYSGTERDSYYGAGFDANAYGTTDNPLWIADGQANLYRKESTLTWGAQATRDAIEDVQLGYDRVIEEEYTSAGVFVQDDRKVARRLSLLYGARLDDHSAVEEPIVSPRAALLWAPRAELTVRASAAAGFRPPVVFDEDLHITLVGGGEAQVVRNDPDLEEESSTSFLLGAEWRPTFGSKGAAALEANLFRTELEDLFNREERDDPATEAIELARVNFGGARVEGVELNAALRWGSRLAAEAGLTLQTARFDRPEPDFGSRDFFRTPERYGLATVQWSQPGWFDLFVGALYTGPMTAPHYAGFIAEDRLERTPSFVTFDVNLSRTFELGETGHREVTVKLGGKNLSGEYQDDLDRGADRDPSYVYGPRFPRSWFVGVRLGVDGG